jgi:hypothetical protein
LDALRAWDPVAKDRRDGDEVKEKGDQAYSYYPDEQKGVMMSSVGAR